MNPVLQPWHLLVVLLAGWINHRQREVIDYLRTENQILKKACGKNGRTEVGVTTESMPFFVEM